MKLYYDMLIPYMPDSSLDEDGKIVHDEAKAAGRLAMMELSKFQLTGDTVSLYHSVIYACDYAHADLITTILNIPEDIVIAEGTSISELIDASVKNLFESVSPEHEFDLNKFVAYILTATHIVFVNLNSAPVETPTSEPIVEDITETDK